MNNQNLIIYEFDELYKILLEIKKNINLNLKKANKVNILELNLCWSPMGLLWAPCGLAVGRPHIVAKLRLCSLGE